MDFQVGQVVLSSAGHDKGELFLVTGHDENRVYICNGKDKTLENPKAKNPKHIKKTEFVLENHSMATNRSIRKQLNKIATYGG